LFQVIIELAPLLSEADLHIAQLTLTLLTSIAQLHPAALARVSDAILPEIFVLVRSPLLQGVLQISSIQKFYTVLLHG
jgi:cullin-associated NEDD8-dissociated protein 1